MLIMGLAMLVMVFASLAGGNKDPNIMSPAWLIGTYFIVTLAEILISPMGQSFVSKVAPPRIAGLMMGGWFAATAAGSYGSRPAGQILQPSRPPPVLPPPDRADAPGRGPGRALPEEAQALRRLITGGHP